MTDDITAYRDQLAAEKGIDDADRDLLMTGTTEEVLLAQANLLAGFNARPLERRNVAPREGRHVDAPHPEDRDMREFARQLIHGPRIEENY
ncbi:hypothetical protein [Microbacterium sp. MMO-113]|uniref:hypothetical protein n=1 Tax=Microbacterium sp. MMO-113 TaxID=3081273 RepID=UPI003017E5F3